jgi:Domain of unknown function (DUF4188)
MPRNERMTAHLEGEFVVFLIGARINRPWKIHKWLPVVRAMPRMIKELVATPGSGLLGYEMWFGRTTIMLQYWRSTEQLLSYAKNPEAEHLPAWKAFNQAIGTSGDVGVWHETYVIAPGSFETVYVNMPLFGLGKAAELLPATGQRQTARDRLRGIALATDRPFPERPIPRG